MKPASHVSKIMMLLIALIFMGGAGLDAQVDALMPQPASVQPGQGGLAITGSFAVALTGYQEPRLKRAAQRLVHRVSHRTGIPILDGVTQDASTATLVIHCDHAGEPVQTVGEDESYTLDVTPRQARLSASEPLGMLRGIETFLQLIHQDSQGFVADTVQIQDHPRFAWRGLMLDAARHWMPLDVVYRTLDGMAAVKLNVFHWHLSDDQGFRVESKLFPKLEEMGSDGHYYTQAQVKEVIAYARDRGIRVVPEFDMPGHATAWFVGYPELASGPGPYQIERDFGIFDPAMDPTRESTYRFLDAFIGEMAALFPGPYFHIGGDEVNGKQWDRNPRIQAFMRQHGMKTDADLQTYFSTRVLGLVQKHGKKTIGWDEVFHPGLPKDIVIQSWRGPETLAATARQGYMSILSNGYYLDLMQSAAQHYAVEPFGDAAAGLTPEQKAHILGGEACMWSEYVTPMNVDSRLWPRAAAIAERLWSPAGVSHVGDMYRRLAVESGRLDFLGLKHHSNLALMHERLTGLEPARSLDTLDSILEAVKGYAREDMRHYTSLTPLNRLVDATPPESDAARQFATLVASWSTNRQQIRKLLTQWRDNRSPLVPLMARHALLEEDIPLAEEVTALAATGLEALNYLESGKRAPPAWASARRAWLGQASKPTAELAIAIVPSIQVLVDDAAKGKP
ncbi:MAG: beta-N-acetylhexosaminidase [Terriglobia bacterium]